MSPRKLAVFVEGLTEQFFLESLLKEVAGGKNIEFDLRKVVGDKLVSLSQSQTAAAQNAESYFALIVNCQNDERVKSVVIEQRNSLMKAGHCLILGLRDLYPNKLVDLASVKARLSTRVPTAGVPTHILLAVCEIEAWFLQEFTHFSRIDQKLDVSTFKAAFGFDPAAECAESVEHPAEMLHQVYSSVGKAYRKNRRHLQRTTDALDYDEVYVSLPAKLPHLKTLVDHIDNFLSPPPLTN
jgi:hypothetical protein